MKKHPILLTCALLLTMGLHAQNESPVVVVSTQGKVRYVPATDSKKIKLAPGAVVKKSGTLQLGKKATALVFSDGRFQRLQGKEPQRLSIVFGEQKGLSSLNFDPEFGQYVLAAVELAAVKKGQKGWGTTVTDPKKAGDGWGATVTDPKKAGDGWGATVTDPKKAGDGWGATVTDPKKAGDGWGATVTDPKKAGDAWGGKGAGITPIMPFGNVSSGTINFSWSKPAGAGAYRLDIMDENNKSVHSATVQDTATSVDLGKIGLPPGRRYSWKVSVPASAGLVSDPREISVASEDDRAAILKKASNSKIYADGDAVLRGMMEAVALEKAEWYYDAEQKYAMLFKQHSNNNMLRMTYAAFWMRYGLEPKAKGVINK